MHKKYQLSLKLQNNINSFLRFPRIPNLVAVFMLLSYLYVTIRYAFDIHKGGDPYLTGDWLINYAGGYTSRGLVGQVLFSFCETFGFNLIWTTYLFQVLIYSVYIFPVIFIVRQISDPFIWVIGLSPFFVIFDFLDTGGSFRKENLGFACISLLALAIVLRSKTHLLLVLAATVFLLLSFSWEGAISFIPMVVFLLLNLYRNSRISKLVLFFNFGVYSLTILLSYIGVIFSQNHLSASASMQVCESLKSQGIGESICVGRISSINKNGQIRVFDNLSTMWVQYNGTKFLLLLLLALLPFMLSGWIRSNKFTFFALSISVVPLFLVPTDYGRNYHILGVVLSMAWCVDRVKTISHPSQGSVITEKQLSPIFIVLSFLYTILWRIPALGAPSGEEFLGVAGRLISWGKKLIILMS